MADDSDQVVARLLDGLSPAERERAEAGGQFQLGMFDIVTVMVSALVGRGLIEGENLRRDLLGMAKMWRQQGFPLRAIPIERAAENLTAAIEACEAVKRHPPAGGSA